jgi:hypothetical protein
MLRLLRQTSIDMALISVIKQSKYGTISGQIVGEITQNPDQRLNGGQLDIKRLNSN